MRVTGLQESLKPFVVLRFMVQPESKITRILNDCRHPVVNIFYGIVGIRGDDSEGSDDLILTLLVFSFPMFPKTSHGQRLAVFPMNEIGLFRAFPLFFPFEKSQCGHQAPPVVKGRFETSFGSHGFGPGVDHAVAD